MQSLLPERGCEHQPGRRHQPALRLPIFGKQAASRLGGARDLLRELTAQILAAEAKQRQRDEAELEFTRYDKLAKAPGGSGLQGAVVQRMLERIKISAKHALGRLTAGWRQSP